MDFVEEILIEMGFLRFLDTFMNEGYTDKETFLSLTYEGLKSVIPQAGPRDLFWSKFQKTIEVYSSNENQSSHQDESSTMPPARNSSESTPDVFISPKIPCRPADSDNSVKLFLKTAEGQMVKNQFDKDRKVMVSTSRQKLSAFLIAREYERRDVGKDFKMTTERFQQLKSLIHIEFPEMRLIALDHFFVPYDSKTRTNTKGSLYKEFNKLKENMGITKKRTRTAANDEDDDVDANEPLDYVRNHLTPEATLRKYWTQTREHRFQIFSVNERNQFRLFVDSYPILSSPRGYIYFIQDFAEEHPEAASRLLNEWSALSRKLRVYGLSTNPGLKNDIKKIHGDLIGLIVLASFLGKCAYSTRSEKKGLEATAESEPTTSKSRRLEEMAESVPTTSKSRRLEAMAESVPTTSKSRRLEATAESKPTTSKSRRLEAMAESEPTTSKSRRLEATAESEPTTSKSRRLEATAESEPTTSKSRRLEATAESEPTTSKSRKKFTKQEVIEALFIHTSNEEAVLEHANDYFKKQNSPVMIFVGKTKLDIKEFHVAVAKDVIYKMESVVEAIDVFMKISIVCKKVYCDKTAAVWEYLQRFVYDIHMKNDKFLSVLDLNDKFSAFNIENESNE
ncbi:hypothetical protein DMENIID0001_000130 [Sergentomyia squamirostris]